MSHELLPMRPIATARCTLEPQVAAHADEMHVVLGDPALYEYEHTPPQSTQWLRERFTRLETRRSPDGSEHWLNWVIRLPTRELIGYVQSTVRADGTAAIAYVLHSRYWGRGLASEAVMAMIAELGSRYRVQRLSAVLRQENRRSRRLLERLGFALVPEGQQADIAIEAGELLMRRAVADPWEIRVGGLDNPAIIALLGEHLRNMALHSPPESVHALNLDALRQPGISFWSLWHGSSLAGVAALKELDAHHGEVKSMRTVSGMLRQGVASRLLQHVLQEARRRSYQRLSLETGSMAAFEPAHRLYGRFGFTRCGPFADYAEDPYSVFMTLIL